MAYEAGGASLRAEAEPNKVRLIPVCASGLTPGQLPSPFNQLQIRSLANLSELQTLVKEIARFLRVTPARFNARKLSTEAAVGSLDWGNVLPTLLGLRQESSPFNFLSLLNTAESSVFCAGFNLRYVAKTDKVWPAIVSWLKKSPGRTIRLLVSNTTDAPSFIRLQAVDQATALSHLRESRRTFLSWKGLLKKLELDEDRIDIRTGPCIGLTVTAIDPEEPDGQLALTPTIFKKHLHADRPHFWVSKKRHQDIFNYYWDTYRDLFDNHSKSL